jgi:telomerase protein component 1
MAQAWKTVRVFISSTFRDMQAERDHLVRFVFPRLREQLLPRRIHLVDVDLRWGVTSEQDATQVCREIINECRPRFLCMLGGRYGWVPPGKNRSITADEVHYGVLDQTLKDRGFAYFYFRDDAATAAMVETTPGEFREPNGSDNQNSSLISSKPSSVRD